MEEIVIKVKEVLPVPTSLVATYLATIKENPDTRGRTKRKAYFMRKRFFWCVFCRFASALAQVR
jgi:hypothetical protein